MPCTSRSQGTKWNRTSTTVVRASAGKVYILKPEGRSCKGQSGGGPQIGHGNRVNSRFMYVLGSAPCGPESHESALKEFASELTLVQANEVESALSMKYPEALCIKYKAEQDSMLSVEEF